MSHSTFFHIIYDGPALEKSEMDIRELAPALLALSDALEETNAVFNQSRAKVAISVKGSFKTGSFGIDLNLNQDLLNTLLNVIGTEEIKNGATLIAYLGFGYQSSKGLLAVLKWLRNRAITCIKMDGEKAEIFVDDEMIEVEKEVVKLLGNHKVRKALERAIVEPLRREGITSFACTEELKGNKTEFEVITAAESLYFVAPEPEDEEINESRYETNLQSVSISFQEDNKWRFSDGTNTFYAVVADADFIEKVQKNEIFFAKDDILRVQLYMRQTLTANGIKSDYIVEKVLDHRSAARQLKLPMA